MQSTISGVIDSRGIYNTPYTLWKSNVLIMQDDSVHSAHC